MNAVISSIFPVVAHMSRAIPFVFFAAMMVIQFIVVRAYYPETKNVSLENFSASSVREHPWRMAFLFSGNLMQSANAPEKFRIHGETHMLDAGQGGCASERSRIFAPRSAVFPAAAIRPADASIKTNGNGALNLHIIAERAREADALQVTCFRAQALEQ